MKAITVLDTSAIFAYLQVEPGQEVVLNALQTRRCVVSAANQAEVIAKSLDRGLTEEAISNILSELTYTPVDIPVLDAGQAGRMRSRTRSTGLSLGDRL